MRAQHFLKYQILELIAVKRSLGELYGQRPYRKDKYIEEKAKVVAAAVWGADLVQLLAALAVLPRPVLKKRLN